MGLINLEGCMMIVCACMHMCVWGVGGNELGVKHFGVSMLRLRMSLILEPRLLFFFYLLLFFLFIGGSELSLVWCLGGSGFN